MTWFRNKLKKYLVALRESSVGQDRPEENYVSMNMQDHLALAEDLPSQSQAYFDGLWTALYHLLIE
jgi:hypothetical protein